MFDNSGITVMLSGDDSKGENSNRVIKRPASMHRIKSKE